MLASCAFPVGSSAGDPSRSAYRSESIDVRSDVGVARPPYSSVETEWKERLDQAYVFLELLGPYEQTGRFMPELAQHLEAQGIRAEGAPFALFYDDPTRTAASDLRSRLAVPVAPGTPFSAPLGYAILPSDQVIYARVAGAYDSVSLAYPSMFSVMRERGWVLDGPIREIYLVDPTSVRSFDELVTEIQMPWRPL
ncbi:Bacterial transcription activator, effector binding domain [Planctomycetes bacterium Pla163]|uniref:Bacterial transcription activator, effector binding domain n=2 Tax=Rohdeia mirabilis TaxID=2528008 RepID=A0A518D0J3_9BACT|nr:Bacterial transcription activator, effector binding domain [Planctomycetes bacterium Pla163]